MFIIYRIILFTHTATPNHEWVIHMYVCAYIYIMYQIILYTLSATPNCEWVIHMYVYAYTYIKHHIISYTHSPQARTASEWYICMYTHTYWSYIIPSHTHSLQPRTTRERCVCLRPESRVSDIFCVDTCIFIIPCVKLYKLSATSNREWVICMYVYTYTYIEYHIISYTYLSYKTIPCILSAAPNREWVVFTHIYSSYIISFWIYMYAYTGILIIHHIKSNTLFATPRTTREWFICTYPEPRVGDIYVCIYIHIYQLSYQIIHTLCNFELCSRARLIDSYEAWLFNSGMSHVTHMGWLRLVGSFKL